MVERMTSSALIPWLLESDPALRWQVQRDLLDAEQAVWQDEQERLPHQGWCARLLGLQDPDGLWSSSLYNGKWRSTTYTLYLLKILGLPQENPQAVLGCVRLLQGGLFQSREIRFSRNQAIRDLGVTGLVLSVCSYHGIPEQQASVLENVVDFLADMQDAGGYWLPNQEPTSADYVFETTLLVLEGLGQYRSRFQTDSRLLKAESAGQEFLLRHHLFLQDGTPVKRQWTSFSFPSYWFYDVLTALEYFRASGAGSDQRLQPAIDLVLSKRGQQGSWMAGRRHAGKTWFDLEEAGVPSRWNTLRALRVLRRYGPSAV